jgi:5-methylcytosine-specific restriction enzyme subunit McrC
VTGAVPVYELVEYGTASLPMSDDTARRLRRAAGSTLSVSPGLARDTVDVKASEWVGTVVLPDLHLVIRPKIGLDNLFVLLDIGLPDTAWRTEDFNYAGTADLLVAVAAMFSRLVRRALAWGLLRSYRREQDRLVAPRGRLDVPAQLRMAGMVNPVACRFFEHTPDVDENRALKAALRRIAMLAGVPGPVRAELRRDLARLDSVADMACTPHDIDRITITRLNHHYEPALRLARLILTNASVADRPGPLAASSFLLDMNALFERFVTDRVRRHLKGRLEVLDQQPSRLDIARRVPIRPDLLFRRDGSVVYVADLKYKVTTSGLGLNADYYQLLAYTTALDLPEGLLIYAQVDGTAPDREVVVRFAGTALRTTAVHLAGSPRQIDEAMASLAAQIAERADAGARQALGARTVSTLTA